MNYANRMDLMKESAIRAIQKKIIGKTDLVSFAAGLPDGSLFPLEQIRNLTDNMLATQGTKALQYGMSQGYAPLLDAIACRMKEKSGIDCTRDNIIISTGAQQGIFMAAMAFVNEGDIVLAENPTYLGGINSCRPFGCSFLGVDTDDDGVDIEDLKKVLAENPAIKMIYVIPNFQNPTGIAWSLERRIKFMEVVNQYDVIILEDDPYGEIRFEGKDLPTLKALDTKGNVVYLGSFSKILCPGLRVSWVCASKETIVKMEMLKQVIDLQSNEFAQIQVHTFLTEYDIDSHIEKIKSAYQKRCSLMLSCMEENFPSNVRFTRPQGGMFVWVELPKGIDATLLIDDAIEAGVSYIPGEFFYANEGAKNTMRLNYTTVSEEQIIKGIGRLAEVFKKACQ